MPKSLNSLPNVSNFLTAINWLCFHDNGLAVHPIDFATSGSTDKDWVAIWNKRYEALAAGDKAADGKCANPAASAFSPQPFPAYTGKYRNSYLGNVEITEGDGDLKLLLGPSKRLFALKHWDRDTFLCYPFEETPAFPESGKFFDRP